MDGITLNTPNLAQSLSVLHFDSHKSPKQDLHQWRNEETVMI
jgi:hypothetical protein